MNHHSGLYDLDSYCMWLKSLPLRNFLSQTNIRQLLVLSYASFPEKRKWIIANCFVASMNPPAQFIFLILTQSLIHIGFFQVRDQ